MIIAPCVRTLQDTAFRAADGFRLTVRRVRRKTSGTCRCSEAFESW